MKLTYFQGAPPNFGDELNTFLWPRLLPPGFLDQDDRELFIGIGSILYPYDRDKRKYVFGSGYGGYSEMPDVHDGSWDIVFVRGPQTARLLGLPPESAISDGAVLLRAVLDDLPPPAPGIGTAFIPHFRSLPRGQWQEACRLAGITMIDPTEPFETVIARIRGADLVITEAMHGAICSDAMRVPWVPIRPLEPIHRMKWTDWAESLGIDLQFQDLAPSSLVDLYTHRRGAVPGGRRLKLLQGPLAGLPNRLLVRQAAARLRMLARTPPCMSRESTIDAACERAMAAVSGFVARRSAA